MTYSSTNLSNTQPYDRKLQVHTGDGGKLSITAIGDIPHSLPLQKVFLSLGLSTNLLFVGQLVNNHCNISFSSSGSVVQDQESGRVIAKGPKCGRLFSFYYISTT